MGATEGIVDITLATMGPAPLAKDPWNAPLDKGRVIGIDPLD